MRNPEGYIWYYPGFYSLTQDYGNKNNFFFSDQTGLCILCFLELRAHGLNKFSYFCIANLTFNSLLNTLIRGHYFLAMLIGIFFAHFLLKDTYFGNSNADYCSFLQRV